MQFYLCSMRDLGPVGTGSGKIHCLTFKQFAKIDQVSDKEVKESFLYCLFNKTKERFYVSDTNM